MAAAAPPDLTQLDKQIQKSLTFQNHPVMQSWRKPWLTSAFRDPDLLQQWQRTPEAYQEAVSDVVGQNTVWGTLNEQGSQALLRALLSLVSEDEDLYDSDKPSQIPIFPQTVKDVVRKNRVKELSFFGFAGPEDDDEA